MYNSSGYVLREKPSIGIEPTRLYDASRFKNHGTHTNVTMVQLPSGLWVRELAGDGHINCGFRSSLLTPKQGTILAWCKGSGMVFASSDKDTNFQDEFFLRLRIGAGDNKFHLFTYAGGASDQDLRSDDGAVDSSVWQLIGVTSNGTAISMTVNGVAITVNILAGANNGNWFGDNASYDNTVIGALNRNGSYVVPFTGQIALPLDLNYALSVGQIKNVFEEQRHWFGV